MGNLLPGRKNRKKREPEISEEVLCGEYEAVYRYLLVLCRDETTAQDLTQETFLKALKSRDRFAGDSSLYTWLCAIGKHCWLDLCRRQPGTADCSELALPDGTASSPEEQVVRRDDALTLHRALHALREPYKEVFSLRVLGQLSFREIASLFDKSESWARVTCFRAKKQILEQIGEDEDHDTAK